ncbi:MAG TPA: hypothetical protein VME19_17285, partial [Streptosporangiaceae bacterium]|nr:hypothetical protein [Streptosporangiaceae bacterium]
MVSGWLTPPRIVSSLCLVVAAQWLSSIVHRVQHYPAGDQLDVAAPEHLGPNLSVNALFSNGQAAHHRCSPV